MNNLFDFAFLLELFAVDLSSTKLFFDVNKPICFFNSFLSNEKIGSFGSEKLCPFDLILFVFQVLLTEAIIQDTSSEPVHK